MIVASMAVLAGQRLLVSRRSATLPTLWVAALVGLVVMVPTPTDRMHHHHPGHDEDHDHLAAAHDVPIGNPKAPVRHGRGLMWGDMRPYPDLAAATDGQRARVTGLCRRRAPTHPASSRMSTRAALGMCSCAARSHRRGTPPCSTRERGGQFSGRLLDPTAPDADVLVHQSQAVHAGGLCVPRTSGPTASPLRVATRLAQAHHGRQLDDPRVAGRRLALGATARCMPWRR